MASQYYYHPASYVVTKQSISAVFTIINLYVAVTEIRKRRRDKPKFKSFSLKWLSLLSILGGFLHSFTRLMHYFNGLCLFMGAIYNYIGTALPICVGLYQLCRLYQCFADRQVSGGYPKWLFYAMGTFGILYLLAYIPIFVYRHIISKCGLTAKYEYYALLIVTQYDDLLAICDYIASTLYFIWDITTLLLLVFKLRSLTKATSTSNNANSQYFVLGIQRNLTRIVILTVFYMLTNAMGVIWYFIFGDVNEYWVEHSEVVFYLLSSTSMSYAVFLMQPHNSREYGLFLDLLICLKLHFCCCCYRYDVVNQREYFLPKYKAVYKVTDSGVELESPLIIRKQTRVETGTVFNDFSMNEPPSAKYQAPTEPLRAMNDPVLQNVWELDTMNDFLFELDDQTTEQQFSSGFSFGDYLEYWRPNRHNSVMPRYSTLKEELTMNRHATITEDQYEKLKRECETLKSRHSFVAKDIGVMNKVCGIQSGSEMTVEHVICVKLYIDFAEQHAIFKKQCRRLYEEEPIENVIRRNSEIAHWCRLLRECVMFFGEEMTASDVVYCGLNARLIFRSLHQRFECPLSTTKRKDVAIGFAEDTQGIILTLKRSSPKTRYLDMAPFTVFQHEEAILFFGSTLKIVDISIGLKSLKKYINVLRMLEQIANGYFIEFGEQTGGLLLSLLQHVVATSLMDTLRESPVISTMTDYLENERYDTDAVVDDIENVNDGNILCKFGGDSNEILAIIKETLDGQFDLESVPHSEYVWYLFTNFLDEMRVMKEKGTLWMNHNELDREEFSEIKKVLFGDGKVFDALSIDKETIPSVEQFEWVVDGHLYQKLKALSVSRYISSPQFTYDVPSGSDRHRIKFHFRFYRQYSAENPQCAIYLEIDEMHEEVKRLRVEVDMKCDKKKKFKQLLRTRVLSAKQRVTGFVIFDHREVNENEKMKWMFAVKMFDAEVDEEKAYLRDLYQIFE